MKSTLMIAALASAAMLSAAQAQTIGTAMTDVNIRSGPGPENPVIGMIRDRQRATVLGCIEGSRWCQVDFRGRTGWAYSQYMTLSGDMAAVLPAPEIEVDVTQRAIVAAPPAITYPAPGPYATYQAPYQPAPMVTYQAPPVVTYQAPTYGYQTAPNYAYQTAPNYTYQAAPNYAYQTAPTYQTAPAYTYRAPAVTYRAPTTTVVDATTGMATRDYSGRLIAPRETVYAATTPPPAYVPPRAVRTYLTSNPLDPIYLEGNLAIGAGLPDDIDLMPVPNSRYQYTYVNDYPVLVDPASRRIVYVSR